VESEVKQIGIKVPLRLSDRLEEIARRESNGISAVCRRLLTEALEREKTERTVKRG
jgi:metal-responsive CopG/Arc/MetJ family transcriptional regulator